MKTYLRYWFLSISGAAILLPTTVLSQVEVTFANLGPGWSRPIYQLDGITPLPAGPDFNVELTYDSRPFGGTDVFDNPAGPTTLIIAPGIFAGGIRNIAINLAFPGAPMQLDAIVRVWDSSTGATDFNSAILKGQSLPFIIDLPSPPMPGVPPPFPSSLINMQSFAIVPEPSPALLALSGVVILLGMRFIRQAR